MKQSIDQSIDVLRNEIFDKENKAAVAIVGEYGAGKTHRLLLMKKRCEKNKVFNIFVDIANETRFLVDGIVDNIIENADLNGFSKYVNNPEWYKDIKKLKKYLKNNYDPVRAGQSIVKALNANAPAVLLLNDLHNLKQQTDLDNFVRAIQEIIDHSDPGVLVVISCRIKFYKQFFKKYKALHERINANIVIPDLKDDEAGLLIAKRMLEKRMVDNLEPLYPYTDETVKLLNDRADGNPRNILKLSSFILDQATNSRTMTINDEFTREQLNLSKNRSLEDLFEEKVEKKQPISKISSDLNKVSKLKKKKDYDESLIKKIGPTINPHNNPGNPGEDMSDQKPKVITKMVPTKTRKIQPRDVRVKCPKCSKLFVFQVQEDKEKMKCPNPDCDFVGIIKKK